jgi:hypothetical protein
MPPNLKTELVTLSEVVTGDLAGKFGEISLYNQHADFELGSASNSMSTSHTASAVLAGPTQRLFLRAEREGDHLRV